MTSKPSVQSSIYSAGELHSLYFDCRAFLAWKPENDDERYQCCVDMFARLCEGIRMIRVEAANREPGAAECGALLEQSFGLLVNDMRIIGDAMPHLPPMDFGGNCSMAEAWNDIKTLSQRDVHRFPDVFAFLQQVSAVAMATSASSTSLPSSPVSKVSVAVVEVGLSTVVNACAFAWASFQMRCICQVRQAVVHFAIFASEIHKNLKVHESEAEAHDQMEEMIGLRVLVPSWVQSRISARRKSPYFINGCMAFRK